MNCFNMNGTVSINHQNVQKLDIEMFKVVKDENPEVVNEIFRVRNEGFYELQNRTSFHIPSINAVFSSTESVRISCQMKPNALRI